MDDKIVNLDKKKIVGSGVTKFTYEIDDNYVCVCPKMINKEKIIVTEYDMLIYLRSFKLPIVPEIELVKIKKCQSGCSMGILQTNIKFGKLYKPMSGSPIELPIHIISKIQNMNYILCKHRIYITDLQLLYNDNEIYIIDPSNVYHVDRKYHIGHDKKLKHEDLYIKYLNQMKSLDSTISYNLACS